MAQFISFRRPQQEHFEGKTIMSDPGVHSAVADEIATRVVADSKILEIGAGTVRSL